jgi:expansin (peptidoglycan-binding protein)
MNQQIQSLTPATQTLGTLNAAFAGLLTEEAAAHGHQTVTVSFYYVF